MSSGHNSATKPHVDTDPRQAPPDLEPLRRFLNTDGRFHGADVLRLGEQRPAYFERYLPGFEVEALDEAAWRRLARLRDALRAVVAGVDPDAPERLSEIAGRYPSRFAFEGPAGAPAAVLRPARPGGEPEIAVAVLAALHAAVADGRLARLRLCERPECGWCFYDASKNRSARWCSSDPCGHVMKARAYRSRHRGAVA